MSLRQRTTAQSGKSDSQSGSQRREEEVPDTLPAKAAFALVDYSLVISLVLGGCCTNVWAYERLLHMNPSIGSALTFSQMLFITVQSLPSFLERTSSFLRLKPRRVPLSRWAVQVLVLTAGSLMNNWAFAYQVPLTVQIVFRAAGLPVSMLFGFLFSKKRYSYTQILSVLLVTAGVFLVTLSRPSSSSSISVLDFRQYTMGILMLLISLVLTGILGLLQERTYRQYGPCWQEGVFYTHLLALPVFYFLRADVKQGIQSLGNSPRNRSLSYFIMSINLVSQLVCVSGVNQLSSRVSSVSTNLVLTVRKALSLCFSVWWFGNGWNIELGAGALLVFMGSVLFSL